VVAGEVAGEGTDAPRGSLPTNETLWASAQRRWTERRSRASRGPAGRSLGSFRWRALDACLAYRVLSFRPALGLRAAVLPPDSARAMAVQVPAFFDLDTFDFKDFFCGSAALARGKDCGASANRNVRARPRTNNRAMKRGSQMHRRVQSTPQYFGTRLA